MTDETTIEVGVYYKHLEEDEVPGITDFVFEYNWSHSSGITGKRRVSVLSGHRTDLLKLLDHWNSKSLDWKYWS